MTRAYRQKCRVAKALDVVGERWTLLLVRDLLLGGRRYGELLRGLAGITTNLLAQRLAALTEAELVEHVDWDGVGIYQLTALGRALEPVVLALGAFGEAYLAHHRLAPDPDDRGDPRWAMVSMLRRYRGSARGWTIGLHVGDQSFTVVTGGDHPVVRDGAPGDPDLRLRADPSGFIALLYGGVSARTLVEQGALDRDGPARVLTDFARAFGLRA